MINFSKPGISERQENLYEIMSSQKFLKMQGLNNEVPFFIFPYSPQEQTEIEKMADNLINQLSYKGIRVHKIDLYDLAISILKDAGIFNIILKNEPRLSKKQLFEDLQGALDPENYLVPAIVDRIKNSDTLLDILFITGVGKVYPYIRSHNILNNLQRFLTDHPTVLWFPGEYTYSPSTGSSLKLFGILSDNRYYRAFNLLDYKI